MKLITAFLTTFLFSFFAFAGFQGYQSTTNLGLFQAIKCSTGLTCTKQGEKINIVTTTVGTMRTVIAASTTSLTSSQCGSVILSSSTIQAGLPNATSALIGCHYTFVTGIASTFQVNPGDTDTIVAQTNAAGDRISNTTAGNTITLLAVAVSQWVVTGISGTWADSN